MTRTMARQAASWCFALGLALATGEAIAGEEARLGLHFQSLVSGDEQPAIVVAPPEGVASLSVQLERADGNASRLSSGPIGAGARKVLPVSQPFGEFGYSAHVDATFVAGGKTSFDIKFSLTRVDKLKLELAPEDVHLDKRTLGFRINNPAKRATLELYGKSGAKLATVERDLGGAAGGTPLTFTWEPLKEEILYMDFKVTDVAGFWKGIRLSPFSVDIPHEEVEFESGKWDIRASEQPKLQKTLGLIKEALDKYGKLIDIRLYVAGYTDTVGSKEANRTLSQSRARAIAGWYAKSGLRIPIFYQGFGEEVLAKPTADETAEQANRRALYILSGQIPASSPSLPRANWTKL
ncbi:MAG: OmpA family protein [Deltaproteobacteria bacterium]|nr:OmpA family protein [Deltaproteobacteria bacterium]